MTIFEGAATAGGDAATLERSVGKNRPTTLTSWDQPRQPMRRRSDATERIARAAVGAGKRCRLRIM
ncbi:MAG: hypothetical protein ABI277_07190, partial [Burkholderiaceae bacterium]